MRKLLSIFSIALVALFALGCENESENGGSGRTLNFGEATTTSSTIEVGIVPSDTDANYFAGIVEASKIADKDDATIITEYIQKLTMHTGVQFLSATGLTPETNYVAIAFYMGDAEKVEKLFIRTAAPGEVDEPFSIKLDVTNVTHNSVIAMATPNKSDVNYFFRIITELELKESNYTTDKQIMEYCISNPSHMEYVGKGERTIEGKNLAAKFKYIVVAFNTDKYDEMITGLEPVQIFKKEFTTLDAPEVDPDTLFLYENLVIGSNTFTLDVTPVKGEDKLWTYYIFQKYWYDQYLETSRNSIVSNAYFGLYGLRQEVSIANGIEPYISFHEFMTSPTYMGKIGSQQITSYEKLRPSTAYVVAMFYIDPEVKEDPTVIYDYNFVAVEFCTKATDPALMAKLEVTEPIIVKAEDSLSWTVQFGVKTDDKATVLRYGARDWETCEPYYDPEDPTQIRAFFDLRAATDEQFADAKSEAGVTFSFTGATATSNTVFFFEAENSEGARTQHTVRVTPDMFK